MRRKDREITDREVMEGILQKADVCRIALCEDGNPYIVPMNFGYKEGNVYLHCAREGRKIDIIAKNNRVCFEVDTDHKLVTGEKACDWTFKYSSVIGSGRAVIVDDFEEKARALDIIMSHYSSDSSFEYSPKWVENIYIIKIEIDNMTCKINA